MLGMVWIDSEVVNLYFINGMLTAASLDLKDDGAFEFDNQW
ncbi:hypothetical protein [Acetivibrio straminisolvens]|jgi:hypothetical protein|nr:hypothetical protein [Acetivibrio straminisolvens]